MMHFIQGCTTVLRHEQFSSVRGQEAVRTDNSQNQFQTVSERILKVKSKINKNIVNDVNHE